MQRCPPKSMTPFDEMITTKKLQIMKLLFPYIPNYFRKSFAFYIKFAELQNTLNHFSHISNHYSSTNSHSPFDILEEIRPYMSEQDSSSIDTILSILNMLELVKTMGTDFMPDLSTLTDMPDILQMMNMFQPETDNDNVHKKGNTENE